MNWSDYFYYDESSPSCLRWKVGPRTKLGLPTKVKAGDVAGAYSRGSFKVKLDYQMYTAHRIIWELRFGEIPAGLVVDHEDGNDRNNRVGNLRPVTEGVNRRNQKKVASNKSGVNGVCLCNGTPRGGPFYRASWRDLAGKPKTKSFSISKYGDSGAFELALKERQDAIAALNENGAGYTERHGK